MQITDIVFSSFLGGPLTYCPLFSPRRGPETALYEYRTRRKVTSIHRRARRAR